MDYEKKYKNLLAKAKEFEFQGYIDEEYLYDMFPELREESEDERIRKELIKIVNDHYSLFKEIDRAKTIAWLEKVVTPTPQDWNDYKDKPVVLWNAYVQGVANGMERGKEAVEKHWRESEYYLREKQGEQKHKDKYTFKSIPRLLDMIEPTDKAKSYCQKLIDSLLQEGYATDAKIVSDCLKQMNGEKVAMAVMDIEKQGEKPQGKSALEAWKDMRLEVYQQASGNRHEPNYSDDTTKMFSLNDVDEIIEKISEQKPTDNTEPKFHEGDWIVYKNEVCQIVKREEGCNKLVTVFGIEKELVNERNLSTARLWTIQDAKDGDVLVNWNNTIFIFKSIEDETVKYHIAYNEKWDTIKTPSTKFSHLGFPEPQFEFHPATKEQRDQLEKAMTDAGYTFDFEKKELKKIEQKPAWSEEDENILATIIEEGYLKPSERQWLKSLKDRIQSQPKQGWNYNDEIIIETITQEIERIPSEKFIDNAKCRCLDWLKYRIKSLKPQKRWKPSDEQIYSLDRVLRFYGKGTAIYDSVKDLIEQLKKLREE